MTVFLFFFLTFFILCLFSAEAVQPGSRRQAAHPDASERHAARHVQERGAALPAAGWVRAPESGRDSAPRHSVCYTVLPLCLLSHGTVVSCLTF